MHKVWRELIYASFSSFSGRIKVQVLGIVLQLSLDGEDVGAQFELLAVGSEEVLEGELGLPDGELGVVLRVFVAVVEVDRDQVGGQHLPEEHGVVEAQQEDVLVEELDKGLLRVVKGAEGPTIHKPGYAVDGLEAMLGLIGDVFASDEVELERVELASEVGGEERLVACDLKAEVMNLHWLKLIEGPSELKVLCLRKEKARDIEGNGISDCLILSLSVDLYHLYLDKHFSHLLS